MYRLRKRYYTSPASRNSYYFYNKLNYQKKIVQLSLYKKWKSGRNDSGKIIMRTKSSLLVKQRAIRINYKLNYFKLSFIAGLQFIPFKNKLLSLIYFSNGVLSYFIANESHNLFTLFYYNKYPKLKKLKIKNIFFVLFRLKKLTFVSCLELIPKKGAQYTRSSGTKSKIIKFDKDKHTAFLQLASGTKKFFSYYSFVFLGPIALPFAAKCYNIKAGYWRKFGVGSTVRGVAMNPVDHPHGGRTKAIRYQRTPWGKTTKYK